MAIRAFLILIALGALPQDDLKPGLIAEYFDTCRGLNDFPKPGDFSWPYLRRIEPKVEHGPTEGTFHDSKLADHFYTRWTGLVRIPEESDWTFYVESDDGSRVSVDGKRLIDNGGLHGMTEKSATLKLAAGDHPLEVEFFERDGAAGIRLSWSSPSRKKEITPPEAFFHHKDELDRPPAAEDLKLRWKLAANQFARYRIYSIGNAKGDEAYDHDPHYQCGLFGYEIQDDRSYHPHQQTVREIPLILGLTLPDKPLHTGHALDLDVLLDRGWDYEPTRAKGKIERVKSEAAGAVSYKFTANLAGLKAKVEPRQNRVKEGSCTGEVDFDVDRGVVIRLRFRYSITYDKGKPSEWFREMRLVDVLTRRHGSFESEVNRAIDMGVERIWGWLDAKTNHWGEWYDYKEGPTALALLTILKGSLDRNDPRLEKALNWYLEQPLMYIYSVAIGMMAIEAYYSPLDPSKRFKPGEIADKDISSKISPAHKKWMESAANWIISQQNSNYWGYPTGTQDYSNTQYAMLGLLAAQRCGIALDERLLVAVLNRVLLSQERKGATVKLSLVDDLGASGGTTAETSLPALGWAYRELPEQHGGPRASMTYGAIGTLVILDHLLTKIGSARYTRELRQRVQAAVRSAWAWQAEHWSVKINYGTGRDWQFYSLYALERAGMLGGVGSVNGHDWYWEGASWLIGMQAWDGCWANNGYVNLHDTCFAVLFLKRATVRVVTGDKK